MGDEDGKKGGSGDQKIKVGDKEYGVADVENLIANVSTLTKKGESVQEVLDLCARYDMEPSEFLEQSTGALTVISNLIKEGVIDEQGQVKKATQKKTDDDDDLKKIMNLDEGDKKKASSKTEEIVAKAIEGIKSSVEGFGKKLDKLEGIQTSMLHDDYRRRIQGRYENLSDEEADRVLSLAMNDPKKTIWEHAEEASKAKAESIEKIRKEFAEQHGLDYEALKKADENKLNEQEAEGGGAPTLEGKKVKLFGAEGENEVSAAEASSAYLEKQTGGD